MPSHSTSLQFSLFPKDKFPLYTSADAEAAQKVCAGHIEEISQAIVNEKASRLACEKKLHEIEEDLARLKRSTEITDTLQQSINTLEADQKLLQETLDNDNHHQRIRECEEMLAKLHDLQIFLAEEIQRLRIEESKQKKS